jgi:catechol 2,3-dioxygenase-like lactoylglutathione lyase family enzyme
MTEQTQRSQTAHRWYARPVFFVADVNRSARFYVNMLGFEKGWHSDDGAGMRGLSAR